MKKFLQSVFLSAIMACSLSSCEDVPAPFDLDGTSSGDDTETIVTDPAGDGTVTSPYNVAAALDLINNGTYSSSKVYVKGVVTSITEIDTSYGNATFYLADNASDDDKLLVYRTYGLGGEKFTTGTEFTVGDTLVVYAVLTMYNTTPETSQGGQLYSINGVTSSSSSSGSDTGTVEGASGEGTEASPYNVAAAINLSSALSSSGSIDDVYVTGIVSSISSISTSYGNAEFCISDDGTTTNQFLIYRAYYIGGEKFTSEDQLKVGDKVVLKGTLVNYYGNTVEMTSGGQLVSINGSTEGSTGDTGGTTSGSTNGVTIDGTTVTLTNSTVTAGSTSVTLDLSTLGLDNASDVTTVTLSDGATVTFSQGDGYNAPKYYTATGGVRVYAKNTITVVGKSNIASIVFSCDSYSGTDYVGNTTATVAFDGTTATYVNEHTSTSGGVQLRVKTITITYAN